MGQIIRRLLQLPDPIHSFFLWGPRKSGKSHWLRHHLETPLYLDLLQTDILAEFAARPAALRERVLALGPAVRASRFIVIDEVQKAPALLDEVHWLIENAGAHFILSGSSARKLKRGRANLLGGRAWRREMRPLSYREVDSFDWEAAFVAGFLPPHFLATNPTEHLRAYVNDYLREEILEEGLARNLPSFHEFLRVAALMTGELIDYTAAGRDVGQSAKVVRTYYEILEETFLGFRVAPWRKSPARRMVQTERFYLFDIGVTNYLARRAPRLGTPEFGRNFEHFILLELQAFRAYRLPELEIAFWRTSGGQEIDFVLGDKTVALEVKASAKVHPADARTLRVLPEDGPVRHRILVSLDPIPRVFPDAYGAVQALFWRDFLDRLWQGEWLA